MRRRLVIMTEIISPYRIPLFNVLAQESEVDLHVIFLAETDPTLRQWRVYKDEIQFSHQVLPSWRTRLGKFNVLMNSQVERALQSANPDVIVCGGYSYAASWQAMRWARSNNVRFLLWSESNLQDARRGYTPVEYLKRKFLRSCDGFVVPGRSAAEYLRAHDVSETGIFIAPNAVDNNFFTAGAESARANEAAQRRYWGLPARYFLFVGRLVPEKGVFDLLSAYSQLESSLRSEVGLVFVGNGEVRHRLEEQALALSEGAVKFCGFAHREQLAQYYGLAEALILPTYTDTWGLVVNEAMACGLPVIVSNVAGCSADLVREGWNGLLVSPGDVSLLASAMKKLATQPHLCETMGTHSMQHISQYSPKHWSAGMVQALSATVGSVD